MALSIKTEEADALAREVASLAHESLTEAVTVALRERLERLRNSRLDISGNLERLGVEYRALPVHDRHSADEIIGYDESGLPR